MPDEGTVRVGIRWLGHSTVLVELPGLTILTDPLLRRRLGPLRRHGAIPDPASLPPVDLVLLSHAHPDHFDRWSLRRLSGAPAVACPPGLGRRLGRLRGWTRVDELPVGASVDLSGWCVTAVPARHWRWPVPGDTTAVGFLIEGPVGIWFAGDTAPLASMTGLAGRVDLALLPVGRWGPQPTPGHLSPRAAARIAGSVGAAAAVPIHWGTFYPAGLERVLPRALREPGPRFARESARLAPDVDVRVPAQGDRIEFDLPRRAARN